MNKLPRDKLRCELAAHLLLCGNCLYVYMHFGKHELTNFSFIVRQAISHLLWSKSVVNGSY